MTTSTSSDLADPWPAPRVTAPVSAVVSLPGSKSQTNRALVLAALADGPSVVRRPLVSRDTSLMLAALRGLGTHVEARRSKWLVTPGPLSGPAQVDCGLAGTVMRFLPPVAGLAGGAVDFTGDPHMRLRPVGEVLDALRTLGVDVEGAGLPFTVHGTGHVRGGTVVVDASASSQFVSALLLAAPRFDEGVDVRHDGKPVPSLPHIEMTVGMLREHGVEVDDSDANRWAVSPGPDPRHRPDHRARPLQRGTLPGAGGRQRRRGDGPRLAADDGPGRRRAARDPVPHGVRRLPHRRRPGRARHRPAPRASTSTSTTSAS